LARARNPYSRVGGYGFRVRRFRLRAARFGGQVAAPRNDDGVLRRASTFPRRELRPGDACFVAPSEKEGAGNAGCTTHPLPRVQKKRTHAGSTQVRRNHTALPAQWAYGCSVISPANQLFCHRHLRVASQACPLQWRDRTTRLDRTRRTARLAAQPASIATRLTSGDEWPSRPPCRGGLASLNHNFCLSERRIFLRDALDSSGKTGGGFLHRSCREHTLIPPPCGEGAELGSALARLSEAGGGFLHGCPHPSHHSLALAMSHPPHAFAGEG
jgi:hypothetical protein